MLSKAHTVYEIRKNGGNTVLRFTLRDVDGNVASWVCADAMRLVFQTFHHATHFNVAYTLAVVAPGTFEIAVCIGDIPCHVKVFVADTEVLTYAANVRYTYEGVMDSLSKGLAWAE